MEDNISSQDFLTADYGKEPVIVNIDGVSKQNTYYRRAFWTGDSLQVTLMSIPIGKDAGLEMHSDFDQFIRIEDGCAIVMIGKNENQLSIWKSLNSDHAIIIPSGIWHNIINAGNTPLKLYSIYAPPHHPFRTVHKTKEEAEQQELNVENDLQHLV